MRLFREWLTFPLYATALGIPVTVADIEYDGNPLSAKRRKNAGRDHRA